MTYNLPLLRKVRDWVDAQLALPEHASQLNMSTWKSDHSGRTCGTTYCVAGYVAFITPNTKWLSESTMVRREDGTVRNVWNFAQDQLGLSSQEAKDLFHTSDEWALVVLDTLIANAEACEREEEGL